MRLPGSFFGFIERVMKAVSGKLSKDDASKLNSVLTGVGTKNYIVAKGILSALSSSGASKEQIERLAAMLDKAHERVSEKRAPFTPMDKKELREIVQNASLSEKTASFIENLDEIALTQVRELLSDKKTVASELPLPTKKTMRIDEERKHKTPSQKRELHSN